MAQLSRRGILFGLGAGAAGLAVAGCERQAATPPTVKPTPRIGSPIIRENLETGSSAWEPTYKGLLPNHDMQANIKGYASAVSVSAGEKIDFHVSTAGTQDYTITIHRMGYYRGSGGRLMTTSPRLAGHKQPAAEVHLPSGVIRTPWAPSWSLEIPKNWISGLYLASFTTADGYRSAHPFVVRDDNRQSQFLVVLPFSTYQAYNQYPFDGVNGRSLYFGFLPSAKDPAVKTISPDGNAYPARGVDGEPFVLHYPERARTVSFQRPYDQTGFPRVFDMDLGFVLWAEQQGLDVTYTTSLDLHQGRVNPARHSALLFSGHDEYWSPEMRAVTEQAVAHGTHLGYFGANNVYWKVRYDTLDGFPVMTCYKSDPDPGHSGVDATNMWRKVAPKFGMAEQSLLGTMYNGIVAGSSPLIVSQAKHWFWNGVGVSDGDMIQGLVNGEADGLDPEAPKAKVRDQILLSNSPYSYMVKGKPTQKIQSSSLYQHPSGAWVFNAGTFGWPRALGGTQDLRDIRIQRATANLIAKMQA